MIHIGADPGPGSRYVTEKIVNAFVAGVQSPVSDRNSLQVGCGQLVGRPSRFTGDPTLQAPDQGALCRLEKKRVRVELFEGR